MQKVMIKGLAKDEKTLRDCGVSSASKVMVIGSTLDDVLAISGATPAAAVEEKSKPAITKEPLCQQKAHRKILDKGVPEDAVPGIKNAKVSPETIHSNRI